MNNDLTYFSMSSISSYTIHNASLFYKTIWSQNLCRIDLDIKRSHTAFSENLSYIVIYFKFASKSWLFFEYSVSSFGIKFNSLFDKSINL